MNKKNIFILLLISTICTFAHTQEMSLVFCGFIDAPENIKADNNLNFSSIRLQFYETTGWGGRLGGFGSIMMSSTRVIEEENQYIYGALSGGVLLGQELEIWRFSLSLNLLLGAGVSILNFRNSPRHIDFFSEINTDIGIMIKDGFYLSAFIGFQCIGNLFPEFPGTDYIMYYPVWGMAFTMNYSANTNPDISH